MIESIASRQNSRIKLAIKLKQKKFRDETDLFIAEGSRLVEEVLKSDWQIAFCICDEQALKKERVLSIVKKLEAFDCLVCQVNKAIYDKISDTKEPQGILLVVKKKVYPLQDLIAGDLMPTIVLLDRLQDPGNVGTIIRTADAAGCTGIVLLKETVDLFSSKTVRATMGSMFHLPIVTEVSVVEFLDFIKKNQIALYVTALDLAAKLYFQADFNRATAIAFGNEGNGISEALLKHAESKLFIPMPGKAESLNVAAATAIIMYERVRQRCNITL